MAAQRLKDLQDLANKLAVRASGFAMRKRRRDAESTAWRETVTHYLPEPWLIARRAVEAKMARAESAAFKPSLSTLVAAAAGARSPGPLI